MILQHNKEDILSLSRIQSLLIFEPLAGGHFSVEEHSLSEHTFSVRLSLPFNTPVPLSFKKSGHRLEISGAEANLQCPLIHGQLKHYHKNISKTHHVQALVP